MNTMGDVAGGSSRTQNRLCCVELMKEQNIQDFWQENPCGETWIDTEYNEDLKFYDDLIALPMREPVGAR